MTTEESVNRAMQALYDNCKGKYKPVSYTTSRVFVVDPMLSAPKPKFTIDPLFVVPRDGIEPPTHGFSVRCSTD